MLKMKMIVIILLIKLKIYKMIFIKNTSQACYKLFIMILIHLNDNKNNIY